MKKLSIFVLVIALALVLCACSMGDTETGETTGTTMPTIIPMPSTGEQFHPDDDGFIGESESTEPSTSPKTRDHLRIR